MCAFYKEEIPSGSYGLVWPCEELFFLAGGRSGPKTQTFWALPPNPQLPLSWWETAVGEGVVLGGGPAVAGQGGVGKVV